MENAEIEKILTKLEKVSTKLTKNKQKKERLEKINKIVNKLYDEIIVLNILENGVSFAEKILNAYNANDNNYNLITNTDIISELKEFTNYTKNTITEMYNLINNNNKKNINKELLILTLSLLRYRTVLNELTNLICQKMQHIEICGIGDKNPNPLMITVFNLNYDIMKLLELVLNKKLT